MSDEQFQTSLSVYNVFIYALLYTVIFVYLQEDIGYNMVLFLLIIIHVLFGRKAYEVVSRVKPEPNNFSFLITIIPVIVIGSLIVRTISLSFYTFGYTNAVVKSYNLGDKYDPPKKYKVREDNYTFSYFVSTLCLFIIYVIYLFLGDSLKMSPFSLTDIDRKDVFSILSVISLGFLMLYDIDFKSYYQQTIYTLITIIGLMILFLVTFMLHPSIDNYSLIPIIVTSVGGLIGYFVDLNVNNGSDMINEGRVYGSITGYLFSLVLPYVPFINSIYNIEQLGGNENNISVLIQNILGFTSVTMITTTVFEMIDAIEYEKYHSKIYKYKENEKSDDEVLEEKQNEMTSTIINILVFIICVIAIFTIFLFSFGISGQKMIFAGMFSILLTSYFSYNSFISSIIGRKIKY